MNNRICSFASFFVLVVFTCAIRGHAAPDKPVYTDGIVAVVNNEVITVSDVLRQTMRHERALTQRSDRADYRSRINQLRQQTLESLINNELLAAEFEGKGYKLPGDYVSERLDAVVAQQASGDWDKFRAELQEQGMSMAEFEEQLKKQLAAEALFDEEIRRKTIVTDSDVRKYYEENIARFTRPESVKLQVIKIAGENRDEQQIRARLEEVVQALRSGADFADVAKSYSDDSTAADGGVQEWRDFEELPPPFQQFLATAEDGRISPPLPTDDGVWLVRTEETKGEKTQAFENVRDMIEDNLREERQRERFEEFIKNLRDKFYVKKFI